MDRIVSHCGAEERDPAATRGNKATPEHGRICQKNLLWGIKAFLECIIIIIPTLSYNSCWCKYLDKQP